MARKSFRNRLIRAIPVWRNIVEESTPIIRHVSVAGGAAGVIAVADIKKGDQLISVMETDGTAGTTIDRTAEFVANTDPGWLITTDGEIDNTGGTATTADTLEVMWFAWAYDE